MSRPFALARYRRRPYGRRSCWNRAAAVSFLVPREAFAAEEDREVDRFARKHGLTAAEVRDLIARFGNDRATLEREVEKLTR